MFIETVDLDDCGLVIGGQRVLPADVEARVEIDQDERGRSFVSQVQSLRVRMGGDSADYVTVELDDVADDTRTSITEIVEEAFDSIMADGGDGK